MPELATPPVLIGLTAVLSYVLGSVPFGIVMARLFGLGDLRKIGSGNIGATNVLRTGSKPAALLTLIGDSGKGAAAVLIARALLAEDAAQVAALGSFLGHCFPIFLGLKGGKGVATFLGTAVALAPLVGIGACLAWLAVAAITRISSAGALGAALGSVILAVALVPSTALLFACLAALVFWRHKANIARLRAGTEPRIGS